MSHNDPIIAFRSALFDSAAFGSGEVMPQAIRTPEEAHRFFQTQIARTMLARRLVFLIDGVERLCCEVAGRRLLSATPCAEDDDDKSLLAFDALDDPGTIQPALDALAAEIGGWPAQGATVAVRIGPTALAQAAPRGGLSPARLSAAFGLQAAPAEPSDALTAFVDMAGTAIEAAAYLTGDMLYALKGEEPQIDALSGFLEDCLTEIDALPDDFFCPPGQGGMLVLRGSDGDAPAVVIGVLEELTILAHAAPQAVSTLVAAWAKTALRQ
ncbi:hypothetical protein [Cognatishimia sp. F0-27]|uniref:hypothetical protein n=1 Tax=Cognatishimia sp. F0-27 TaxID=2816855 RepID=UPI001D0C7D74|nr:hypothetical protein [Cognatishimia sp. F0-27]MCC1493798.1 hypothetical protein [Cognatishimia sp. F0-27]